MMIFLVSHYHVTQMSTTETKGERVWKWHHILKMEKMLIISSILENSSTNSCYAKIKGFLEVVSPVAEDT